MLMALVIMPAKNACSASLAVDVVPTQFGLKISFKNSSADFDISYSEGFLNLKFKEDV